MFFFESLKAQPWTGNFVVYAKRVKLLIII